MRELTASEQARIDELLATMTVSEKVAQLTGISLVNLMDDAGQLSEAKMAKELALGVGHISLSGGATELAPEQTAENANAIQRFLREHAPHGIPAILNDECLGGFVCMGATHFPQAIGAASTWNPALVQEMTTVIGQQARAAGSHLMYSPVFDVGVDPRWGRTEETLGEDPYLVGSMGSAYITGLSNGDLRRGVIGTLKHFAGYSFTEGGRNCGPAHMGPRELREIFLFPFEMAIKEADAESVMAAYHDIDGVPCVSDRALLTGILRDEWGFPGIVIADWGVVTMLYLNHHYTAANATEAGMQALAAGLDVELPGRDCFNDDFIRALEEGAFPLALADQALRRLLRVKTLLGLFDEALVDPTRVQAGFDTAAQRAVARKVAQQSLVLLKNEDDLLPLGPNIGSIAVIGPNAANTKRLLGDYHYTVYRRLEKDAVPIVSVLDGIRAQAGAQTAVHYARGCEVMDASTAGFAAALEAACQADVIVAVLGGKSALHKNGTSGENIDRAGLNMAGAQEALLRELHGTGKPIVLVLVNGRPLAIEWAAGQIPAILEAWLPGEEGGNAVADVLFGAVNPSGKLPVSLLRCAGQAPLPYNVSPSSLGETAKYVFTERGPVYAFGHGLSYTEFAYSDLRITPAVVAAEETVRVACTVTNSGSRAGDEVIQLYTRDPLASTARPRKELKGFHRLTLDPGETRTVTFAVPIDLLGFYNPAVELVAEAGEFQVMVGGSSEDIRLQGSFTLTETKELGQRRRFSTEVSVG